jgi:hypothetical protein
MENSIVHRNQLTVIVTESSRAAPLYGIASWSDERPRQPRSQLPATLERRAKSRPTPHVCKVWATQPNPFRLDPLHHTVGLNN